MLKQKKTSVSLMKRSSKVQTVFDFHNILPCYQRILSFRFCVVYFEKYNVYFNAMRLVLKVADDAIAPEYMYCDFELGMSRVIRDHFPDAAPIGCLFHFKQGCRRRMKKVQKS